MIHTIEKEIFGRKVTIETGKMARQANGAVVITCGKTVMLATAVMAKEAREGIDFFPLTVEYIEKMYASGKIPGGFHKREAKPATSATLTSRVIDRPIRPCFPKDFHNEVQVIINVFSYDNTYSPEFLAVIAASAALTISDIPFAGPIGAAHIGYVNGEFVANPSYEQMEKSTIDLMVAGTKDAILMVEAGAKEVSEEIMLQAIMFAQEPIRRSIEMQEDLLKLAGKEKIEVSDREINAELLSSITGFMGNKIEANLQSGNKKEISDFLEQLEADVKTQFISEDGANKEEVSYIFHKLQKEQIRQSIIKRQLRPDGRKLDQLRPITCETSVMPNTHGSALFTRGETQSLGVVTLGTSSDEQIEDGLNPTFRKKYYFHYNFPPFSVGEVGNIARVGRRELGHGALAEKALKYILPEFTDFPYTLRLVSEILESNGSSSMASVCSGTLALMDCGVPIKAPVSGIAMGLLINGNDYAILTDIQGLEDHYGDMDFKVAGTSKGITALQLDIKVSGLSEAILKSALEQANKGRMEILNIMLGTLDKPRAELPDNAPKIVSFMIDPDKIGAVIGPGGKMIRKIEEESGAEVTISDTVPGEVSVSACDRQSMEKARSMILGLTREIQSGDTFNGKVVRIMNFGAFVEILPGKDGLIHISKLTKNKYQNLEEVVKIGQMIEVKVVQIDQQNRINLAPVNAID